MTRLIADDIRGVMAGMPDYDRYLRARTGCGLGQLALLANGCDEPAVNGGFDAAPTWVIPITSGQGIIGGFAQTVAGILKFIGFDAHVSDRPDVVGLADAYAGRARMVLMADDNAFSAINLVTRKVGDNSVATGRGFATALNLMAGGLGGEKALVLGCGPVGRSAARTLAAAGARVGLLDAESSRARTLAALDPAVDMRVEHDMDAAMAGYDFILDATPVGDIIIPSQVTSRTMVAAPGVPCGLNADAQARIGDRLVHDPLQIGVAVMAVEAWLPVRDSAP